jgi:hypothetical protein
MPRPFAHARLLAAAALVLAARGALAQGTPGPQLPVGMDLRKAPLGSWAAYTVNLKGMPPLKQRFSLVARDAATSTFELATEGGAMGPTPVVVRVVLGSDLAKPDRLKKLVMQLGDNDPMELRKEQGAPKDQFAPLDPKKLVGRETIKVPAGSLATRHFRDKTAAGRTDVWVSDEAPPFGIVKMEGVVTPAAGGPSYPVVMELTERGKDARAVIVRAPQPFDPNVLQGQMTRSLGGSKPAPSRAAGPAKPAPPPAKPGK